MVGRLILALVLAFATTAQTAADELSISGEITYRERIALPPEAMLRVRLVDISSPDTPVIVEAEGAVSSPGKVPSPSSCASTTASSVPTAATPSPPRSPRPGSSGLQPSPRSRSIR